MSRMRLFLLGFALVVFSPASIAAPHIRVMTWNIARAVGSNGPTTSEQAGIAKIVNYEKPDVWTIQELGGNNSGYNATSEQTALVNFIKAKISIYGPNPQLGVNFYLYVGTFTDNFISNAIISKYPIVSTQAHSDSLRGMYEATINKPGFGNIGVFTTHLKALSSSNDALARQTEVEGDVTFINSWKTSNPATPFVVTGDLNESEDSDNTPNWSGGIGGILSNGHVYHPITTLKSVGLTDPKPVSVRGRKNTESSRNEPVNIRFDYDMFSNLRFLGGHVFDTFQFTAPELAALNATNGTTFVAGDSSSASDHLPVIVDYGVIERSVIPAPVPLPMPDCICFLLGSASKA